MSSIVIKIKKNAKNEIFQVLLNEMGDVTVIGFKTKRVQPFHGCCLISSSPALRIGLFMVKSLRDFF